MRKASVPQPKEATRARSLYFLTWRWHFYAGLFVVPFMIMLSITGLVMLFDDEIEMARYQSILQVQPQPETVPVSQQLLAVQQAYPSHTVTQFIPAKALTLANRFSIRSEEGISIFVTVDPYSSSILGTIDRSDSWYQLANDIHGTLLIGDWGDYLIEISASLGILLLVSGIYLWLPRDNASRTGFLRVRFTSGTRVLLRDLHANIGGGLSIVLLFFLISGLSWAGIWGGKYVQAWSTFPAQKWDDVPLSTLTHASLNHGSEEELPWNLEQTPLPQSHDHSKMQASAHNHTSSFTFGIDEMVEKAKQLGFSQYKLNFPRSDTGVFTLSANTMSGDITDPTQDRTSHFDQYSGQLLADVTWNDYNLVAKMMAAGIALHQGDISILNKIANVLFCLSFILVSITGVVMWWIRRPSGQKRLGVPPQFENTHVWKTGLLTLTVIGVAFPLAGATIAAVLCLDWLLISRVEKLRLALQ
ncbi:PepSY-associated TM helix domain-containing protein [Photobacterium proteolyticum]|uniref:PepSY-associated TM helix domain-containing protein n=1 Tax=Photobacterium proteolyticum TaxID=1903952 RepID=UPI003CCBC0B6